MTKPQVLLMCSWSLHRVFILRLNKFLFKPTVQSNHYPNPSFIRAQELCHWEWRWPLWPSSPSLTVATVSVDVKQRWTMYGKSQRPRVASVKVSRGGRPGLPVPNKPYSLCGRKATLQPTNSTPSSTHRSLFIHDVFTMHLPHTVACHSSGAVWESRWRPDLSVLTSLLVSVDVKNYWTVLRHWSQLVPNMSTDIWGH